MQKRPGIALGFCVTPRSSEAVQTESSPLASQERRLDLAVRRAPPQLIESNKEEMIDGQIPNVLVELSQHDGTPLMTVVVGILSRPLFQELRRLIDLFEQLSLDLQGRHSPATTPFTGSSDQDP